jgi:hypothetical protein
LGRNYKLKANEPDAMRVMLGLWTFVLVGGLTYFIVIGLTHH